MSVCPICGRNKLSRLATAVPTPSPTNYQLFACAGCSVHHWRPLEHPGADFYESESVSIYRDLHDGSKTADDPRFERFFRDAPALSIRRALDIGCSDGTFLRRLKLSGSVDVWGVDIDQRALQVAKSRGLNVQRATVAEFLVKAKEEGLKFDLVTAFDVIEHLTDPVGTIQSLHEILSPGGRFIGTVPNRRRWFVNEMPIDFPPHHFFRFDVPSLRTTLQTAGFEVTTVEPFQYNYALWTLVGKARRFMRSRRPTATPGSQGSVPAPGSPMTRAATMSKLALAPLSLAVEAVGKRGFKLYFSSRSKLGTNH